MTETPRSNAGTGWPPASVPVVLAPESWEAQLVAAARVLRNRKKTCMLVFRCDGLAWQLFEAAPAVRIVAE